MKVIIVGAGLAGLALSAAMRQRAPDVTTVVLERDDSATARGPGYSIGLKGDGAIPVLKRLGIYDGLAAGAVTISSFVFAAQNGKPLLTLNNSGEEKRLNQRVERQALRAALLQAARPVRYGANVVGYDASDAETVAVSFADGTSESADWIVAADGVNSAIRTQMIGDAKHYRGLSAIVGDAPLEIDHPLLRGGYFMTLGNDGSSVFAYRQRGGVHLSYTARYAAPAFLTDTARMADVLRTGTAGWHDPIPQLVNALDPAALVFRDYYDRDPAPRISDGRVWLIGDAAHPMVPFQGLGANMALLDAERLARFFAEGAGFADASMGADAVAAEIRLRGNKAAAESRNAARQFHSASRMQQSMRNMGFRMADRMIRMFSRKAA